MVQFMTDESFNAKGYRPFNKPYEAPKELIDKALASMAGDEAIVKNFNKPLQLLNDTYQLGMDATDLRALGMIYKHLGRSERFGGDKRIPVKENSAIHSMFCVPLLHSVLQDTPLKPSAENARIQQLASVGLLLHDAGECLGEFASLTENVRDGIVKDRSELERKILDHALTHALHTIDSGKPDKEFDLHMEKLRDAATKKTDGGAGMRSSRLDPVAIDRILDEEKAKEPTLSPAMAAKKQQLMDVWTMVELPWEKHDAAARDTLIPETLRGLPNNIPFIGMLAKSTEHHQGARHVLRHGLTDASRIHRYEETLAQTSDKLVDAQLKYPEAEIAPLFMLATSDSEKAIARSQASALYKAISSLMDKIPPYISNFLRRVPEDTPATDFAQRRHAHEAITQILENIAADHFLKTGEMLSADQAEALIHQRSKEMHMMTVGSIRGLYANAARAVQLDEGHEHGFTPTMKDGKPEILGLSRPAQLMPSAHLMGIDDPRGTGRS